MGAQAIRIQQIWDLVSDDSKGLADRPAITMERDADSIKESACAWRDSNKATKTSGIAA